MSLVHDTPIAGHIGNKKTRERIMQYFFWPGMNIDISRYCMSCSACQKGTPKCRKPKARLVPIPKIEVPFSRVAIDCRTISDDRKKEQVHSGKNGLCNAIPRSVSNEKSGCREC